jgi:hypothetical protein
MHTALALHTWAATPRLWLHALPRRPGQHMHLSLADESTIKANSARLQEEESGFSQSSEYLAAMGLT